MKMDNSHPDKEADRWSRYLGYVLGLCLATMVLLVFLNAVLRYGFRSSIPEAEELSRYFFVWTIFLGVILAFRENKHVSVDLLIKRLGGRSKFVVDLVRDLLMLCAFAIMIVGGISYMNTLGMTTGASTPIPLSFISVSVPLSGLVMGLIVLRNLIQRLLGKTSA